MVVVSVPLARYSLYFLGAEFTLILAELCWALALRDNGMRRGDYAGTVPAEVCVDDEHASH